MGSTSPQIKAFIKLAKEYSLKKSEKHLTPLQRQLQILSVVSDLSIFEPTCMETLEFFSCLQMFLSEADTKAPLFWKVINLLSHISHAPSIRIAMRDDLDFLSIIAPFFFNSKLSKDKTLKILYLLHDLSYGVKIKRREAWVIKIIPHLVQFIHESEHIDDAIEPAVITLANLCRGNPSAVLILREYSGRKLLINTLTSLKNSSIKVQLLSSEIMIFGKLDHSKLCAAQILHTLDLLFMVVTDGFADQDETLLQLSIDSFDEMVGQRELHEVIMSYKKFGTTVQNILSYISEESKGECVGMLFTLFSLVVQLEHVDVTQLANLLFTKALPWVPNRRCGTGTLRLFYSLLTVAPDDVIAAHAEEFIQVVKEGLAIREDFGPSQKIAEWICGMLILVEMLHERNQTHQFRLAKALSPPLLSSLLKPFLDASERENLGYKSYSSSLSPEVTSTNPFSMNRVNPSQRWSHKYLSPESCSETVVRILSVTSQLSSEDPELKVEFTEMLGNSNIMDHVVRCKNSSDVSMVKKATTILCGTAIPRENLNALVKAQTEANKQLQRNPSLDGFSEVDTSLFASQGFSATTESVENLLMRLNSAVDKAELRDLPLTDVMELYEYKLASIAHDKRNLEMALTASDTQTREWKLASLKSNAESNHVRSLLRTWEERVQQSQKEKGVLEERIAEIHESSRKFRNELIQEKTKLERTLNNVGEELVGAQRKLEEKEEGIRQLQRQISKEETENKRLQKRISVEREEKQKLNEIIRTKEEGEKKRSREIEDLEKENCRLEKVQCTLTEEKAELNILIQSHEESIAEKEAQIESMTKENSDLKKIRDMIHNISSGKLNKL